jgi:hypothetical protein
MVDMKYIMFWSIDPDRLDTAIGKLKEIVPDQSGRYPEKLSESYSMEGKLEGFRLVEATKEQLTNLMVETLPEMTFTFVPIFEFPEVVKTYMESKNS